MQFSDEVSGGAAWFRLLSKDYVGKTLQQIGEKYTGIGQGAVGRGTKKAHLKQYIDTISKATGLKPSDTLTPDFLAGPGGIAWAKAQSTAEGTGQKEWGVIL
jgi:hypothetical protein